MGLICALIVSFPVPRFMKLFYNMSYLMLKTHHSSVYNILKFNFITSLMICFKSMSNTVAYLFLRRLNRRE